MKPGVRIVTEKSKNTIVTVDSCFANNKRNLEIMVIDRASAKTVYVYFYLLVSQ